jgi:hypothetical protein
MGLELSAILFSPLKLKKKSETLPSAICVPQIAWKQKFQIPFLV